MNDAFNWWMLIVGLVVGAGVVWLVLADGRRNDADVAGRERASEARWIAETLRGAGRRVDTADTLDVLRLHEAYLAAPPPDELDGDEADRVVAEDPVGTGADEVGPWRRPGSTEARLAPPGGRAGNAEARAPMAHPIATGDAVEGSTRDR